MTSVIPVKLPTSQKTDCKSQVIIQLIFNVFYLFSKNINFITVINLSIPSPHLLRPPIFLHCKLSVFPCLRRRFSALPLQAFSGTIRIQTCRFLPRNPAIEINRFRTKHPRINQHRPLFFRAADPKTRRPIPPTRKHSPLRSACSTTFRVSKKALRPLRPPHLRRTAVPRFPKRNPGVLRIP